MTDLSMSMFVNKADYWKARAEEAEAKLEKASEALRFYENTAIYKPHPDGIGFDRRDLSFKARATLKEIGDDNG